MRAARCRSSRSSTRHAWPRSARRPRSSMRYEYIPTYVHTYIHTYKPTYKHALANIQTRILLCLDSQERETYKQEEQANIPTLFSVLWDQGRVWGTNAYLHTLCIHMCLDSQKGETYKQDKHTQIQTYKYNLLCYETKVEYEVPMHTYVCSNIHTYKQTYKHAYMHSYASR